MTDETRARFLAAIAAQLPAERIVEVHLFPAIRQGGMESGVAVLAVERAGEPLEPLPTDEALVEPPAQLAAPTDESPYANAGSDEPFGDDDAADLDGADLEADAPAAPRVAARRYTVYSARYRHTLKGPDRGKWEVEVKAEADAPLITVDLVVQGVMKRAGESFEPEKLTASEFRTIVGYSSPVEAALPSE